MIYNPRYAASRQSTPTHPSAMPRERKPLAISNFLKSKKLV